MKALFVGMVRACKIDVTDNRLGILDSFPMALQPAASAALDCAFLEAPMTRHEMESFQTDFAPCENSNCVGFSASQRAELAKACQEFDQDLVDHTTFSELFDAIAGYSASQRFLDAISIDGMISLKRFQSLCGIDPSSRNAVPFGLYHARKCLARHSAFLGLTFYLPFLIILTIFSVTGRHLTTNRDSVAVLDDVLRSGPRVRSGTLSNCSFITCPADDTEPAVFEEINSSEKWYAWITSAVVSFWTTANNATGINGRALGSIDGSAPVGVMRIRSIRFDVTNDTGLGSYYNTSALLRYRRNSISRAPLVKELDTGLSLALQVQTQGLPVPSASIDRVASWLNRSLTYLTCDDSNSSVSYTGSAAIYPCGGHIIDIPFNSTLQEAWLTVQAMRLMEWVSGDVGALIVELYTFQLNELSFVSYALLQEILPGGHWRDFHYFSAGDVFSFTYGSAFNLTIDILFGLSVLVFFIRFCYDTHQSVAWRKRLIGGAGFRAHVFSALHVFSNDPWIWVDLANLGCMLATSIVRWTTIALQSSTIRFYQTDYFEPQLDTIANLQLVVGYLDAMVVIISYFRLLKYARFHVAFMAIANTLRKAASDLIGTALTFGVLFMGFVIAATNAYSTELEQFEAIDKSASTLLRAILTDLDYDSMAAVHAIFTPIFVAAYALAMTLVTLNIVIALLTRSYETACEQDIFRRTQFVKIAALDSSCFLAKSRRSLWKRFLTSPLISDVRLRLGLLRRCCSVTPSKPFTYNNSRRTYASLEALLVDTHFGSDNECSSALAELILACAERCPDASSDPMPTMENTRALREPGRSLAHKTRQLLGRDCDTLLLLFVWLPAALCDLDAAELVDDLCHSRQEWLQDMDRISHLESSTVPPATSPCNHELVARRYRSIAVSCFERTADALPKPRDIETELFELTGGVDSSLSNVDWLALWCNFGALSDHPLRNTALILATSQQERDTQLERAGQLGWSSGQRTLFCHLVRGLPFASAADLNDVIRRSTSREMPVTSKRILENRRISSRTIASSAGERSSAAGGSTAFLLHFFSENRRRVNDRLQLLMFVCLYVVFAYNVLSHRFLGEGLEAPKHTSCFVAKPFYSGTSPARRTFADIKTSQQYFDWLRQIVLSSSQVELDLTGSRIAGALKLRQLRSQLTGCTDQQYFKNAAVGSGLFNATSTKNTCVLPLHGASATQDPIVRNASVSPFVNGSLFYSDAPSLRGFGGVSTRIAGLVPSDGYGLFLPGGSLDFSIATVNQLQALEWIDDQTRIVTLELLVYSPTVNAFTALAFVTSISSGGTWVNEVAALPFSVLDWTTMPTVDVVIQVVYGLLVLYNIQRFFVELSDGYSAAALRNPTKSGFAIFAAEYFSTLWWPVDTLCNIIFLVTWTLRFFAAAVARGDMVVESGPDYFTVTEELAKTALIATQLDSVNLVLCSGKFLHFLRTDHSLSVFAATIAKSARNIFALAVTTTMLLIAFALAAFCWFGDFGMGFYTLQDALASLLLVTTVGWSRFEDEVNMQSPVTTTVFFVTFILTVKVVLLNLFIAVLTRGFGEVRNETFDNEELSTLLKSDPNVAFGTETWSQWMSSSTFVREICYWWQRMGYAIVGPAEDDGTSGLSELDRIRLRNPRILWGLLEDLMSKIEHGSPTERTLASVRLLTLLRDVEYMLNNPTDDDLHISAAYSTTQMNFVSEMEVRRGASPRPFSALVSVHGFRRRTVEEYVREKLGDMFEELEFLGIALPQVCLRRPKGPCLEALLTSFHAWSRVNNHQLLPATVGVTSEPGGRSFDQDLQRISQKVRNLGL